MLTKLTLTIDKDIVESAKRYAKKENRSISKLVSEYLEHISGAKKTFLTGNSLNAPLTESLSGMFTDNGKPYNELLTEALSDKYLW